MFTRRLLFAVFFALFVFGAAIVLWQKQSEQYNFSVQREKQAFEGFGGALEEFTEDAPSRGEFEAFIEELQKLQLEELGTSTLSQATTTSFATSTAEDLFLVPENIVE